MAFTIVTLTGTYEPNDEVPLYVTFQLTKSLVQNGNGIIPAVPITAELSDGQLSYGGMSYTLVANDDAATLPVATGYIVTEYIEDLAPTQYGILIPSGADDQTIDLSLLTRYDLSLFPPPVAITSPFPPRQPMRWTCSRSAARTSP